MREMDCMLIYDLNLISTVMNATRKTAKLGVICEKMTNCNPATDIRKSVFYYADIASVRRITSVFMGFY